MNDFDAFNRSSNGTSDANNFPGASKLSYINSSSIIWSIGGLLVLLIVVGIIFKLTYGPTQSSQSNDPSGRPLPPPQLMKQKLMPVIDLPGNVSGDIVAPVAAAAADPAENNRKSRWSMFRNAKRKNLKKPANESSKSSKSSATAAAAVVTKRFPALPPPILRPLTKKKHQNRTGNSLGQDSTSLDQHRTKSISPTQSLSLGSSQSLSTPADSSGGNSRVRSSSK